MTQLYLPHYEPVTFNGDEEEYPFVLNVITLMSLGSYSANANLPSLQEISGMTVGATWDSWLEMNPETAHHLHLADHDPVWVESPYGKVQTKVRLVPGSAPRCGQPALQPGPSGRSARWAQGPGRQRPGTAGTRQLSR